jgi:hypothetical protein
MAFSHTGDRQAFEKPYKQRRINLAILAMYAAHELSSAEKPRSHDPDRSQTRYMEGINDHLWAICEETSWVYSAHLKNRSSNDLPDPNSHLNIDLGSAMTGLLLAETLWILDGHIHTEIAERVRTELKRRLVDPYLHYNEHHWMSLTSNWNSVCHCGVIGTAIYLDTPPDVLARMIRTAETGLKEYLDGFDPAGGCAEGIGYWSFGLGHFLLLNDLVERRCESQYSLLDLDRSHIEKIVQFPRDIRLSAGRYANFADSYEATNPELFLLSMARERFGVDLGFHQQLRFEQFDTIYHNALTRATPHRSEESAQSDDPQVQSQMLFPELQWFIARRRDNIGRQAVLATKGGHNGEEHNHNDLGTFIFHVAGQSVFADLGKDIYRKDHFTSKRYEYLSCSAAGHSVPVINGVLQAHGREYRASVRSTSADPDAPGHDSRSTDCHVTYDLSRAYPDTANLDELTRSFRWEESATDFGELTITDRVKLKNSGTYAARFWSFLEPHSDTNNRVWFQVVGPQASSTDTKDSDRDSLWVWIAYEGERDVVPHVEYVPDAILERGTETTGAYLLTYSVEGVEDETIPFRVGTVDRAR